MSLFNLITALVLVHGVSLVSPGPDLFLILRNSIGGSKELGRLTAFGIVLGNLFYISIGSSLSFLVDKGTGELGLVGIKILGGGYLGYIGYKIIRENLRSNSLTKVSLDIENNLEKINWSASKAVAVGFASTALNGKAAAYFLSVVPQFITPQRSFLQNAILFFCFLALSSAWFFGVSEISSHPKIKLLLESKFHIFNKIVGYIFALFSLILLVDGFRAL